MTINDHAHRLQGLLDATRSGKPGNVLRGPATAMLRKIKRRIKEQGQGSGDNKIGDYSTKPIHAAKKQFAFPGAFKQGRSKKTGRYQKTMHLPGGYRQLRQIQGLKSDSVNVDYTGKTMAAFQVVEAGPKVFLAMTTRTAAKRRKQLEKKYGRIYTATATETAAYKAEISAALKRATITGLTDYHV